MAKILSLVVLRHRNTAFNPPDLVLDNESQHQSAPSHNGEVIIDET